MKKITTVLLAVAVVLMAASAFAEEVYVTKRGKRYHRADCKVTRNKEVQKIDQAEAEQKGLKPCNVCFKDNASTSALNGQTPIAVAR